MTYDPTVSNPSSQVEAYQVKLNPYAELIRHDSFEGELRPKLLITSLRAVKLTFWCGLLAFNFYALMLMLWAWVALIVHLASGLPLMVHGTQLAIWLAPLIGLSVGLKVISGYVLDLLGRAHAPQALKPLAILE